MRKKVIALLPGDVVQKLDIPVEANDTYFIGDNGSELVLPVETYVLDGKEHLFARYSDTVPLERIEQAIKTGK